MKKINCAIILARSNSKRIKKKNIKIFHGKPIIYWTIKNVLKSKKFNKVIVSTEDIKVAKLSKKFGATVPFIRPKKLSRDKVGTKEVMNHSIKYLEKNHNNLNYICCFYATSIFSKPNLIRKSFNLLDKKTNYIFCAKKTNSQSFRSLILDKKNKISYNNKKIHIRTQDFRSHYQDLGQFYLAKYDTWKKKKEILSTNSKAIILKEWQATDIDESDDWEFAKKLFLLNKYY